MASALLDSVGLPEVTRLQLANSPLVLALCQVQFAMTLSVADAASLAPFQRVIRDEYPVVTPPPQLQMQFQFAGGEADSRPGGVGQGWTFADRDDTWAIVLSTSSLSVETRIYSHFREFLERLQRALDALIEYINPSFGTRIGLRYVNEIPAGRLSWHEVINAHVLGPLSFPPISERAVQATQELTLSYPDHEGINMRYGLFPRGTTIRPRSSTEQVNRDYNAPFYLLDFDVFRSFQPSSPLEMEVGPIIERVQDYHDVIYRVFRWSITERYLETILRGGS